jgi:hypothetical protein
MHLVLNMFIFTRTLVTYAKTIFKPRCCLNFHRTRPQAESTDIAHNMFGQIKMEIPWYTIVGIPSFLEKGKTVHLPYLTVFTLEEPKFHKYLK